MSQWILSGTLDNRPVRFPLGDGVHTVGRTPENGVALPDGAVSRRHAELRVDGGRLVLRDLGSMNGTFVNGTQLRGDQVLAAGDEVRFGQVLLSVTATEAAPRPLPVVSNPTSNFTITTTIEEIRQQARQNRSDRILAAVSEAGQMLSRRMELSELYDKVLDLISKSITTSRVLILSKTDGEPTVIASKVGDSSLEEPLRLSRTMLSDILDGGKSFLTADASADAQWGEKGSIVSLGVRAAMGAPLFDNDRILGAIYVDCQTPGLNYDADDLRLLTLLGNMVAVKITHSRLEAEEQALGELRRELSLAARIQTNLLPKNIPAVPGYEIFAYQAACTDVGGDLYDVRPGANGQMWILVGDVSGHGVAAALLMSNVMAGVQILTETAADPLDIVTKLEAYVSQHIELGRFLTLFVGLLDPSSGLLRYVNAGQNPPLLIGKSGHTPLENSGLPVAILPGVHSRTPLECRLAEGDLLLIASDGVTEFNHKGAQYDEGRFQQFIDGIGGRGAEETGRSLLRDLEAWSDGAAAADDITVLVIKRQ
jgi:serine phosphatase RsbU (regulator of sigma subunit)/pSer/pThr/pTyr-binding forkhead associated (FHA) protein